MMNIVSDSVSRTNASARGVCVTYTTWQGNKKFSYPESDFVWIRRWTRVGPDGGNTDTVKGTVNFDKLVQFLSDKDVREEFTFGALVLAGVATPA